MKDVHWLIIHSKGRNIKNECVYMYNETIKFSSLWKLTFRIYQRINKSKKTVYMRVWHYPFFPLQSQMHMSACRANFWVISLEIYSSFINEKLEMCRLCVSWMSRQSAYKVISTLSHGMCNYLMFLRIGGELVLCDFYKSVRFLEKKKSKHEVPPLKLYRTYEWEFIPFATNVK